MDEAAVQRALDPFFSDGIKHPGRRVGLGLPFLSQLAEQTGGDFTIESAAGVGTTVQLSIPASHPDAPPLGGLVTAIRQALCFGGDYEMIVHRRRGDDEYTLRRSELVDALGEIESVGSQMLLNEFIGSSEGAIGSTEATEWQR